MARAEAARPPQVFGMVEAHAARALDQRLDDERGDLGMVRFEESCEVVRGVHRALDAAEAMVVGAARGKRCDERLAHERRVGIAEDRDVGDAERAQRLAVVAALQRDELRLAALAAIGPVVRRHLERDLGCRGAVGGEERVAEAARGDAREPFGELDHRRVREAREHDVLELSQLLGDRTVDGGMRVAEEVHPPRAHRVEITAAVEIDEPRALATRDGHEREALVRLHLRARMPHRREAARDHLAVGRFVSGAGGDHAGFQLATSRLICWATALVASVASEASESRGSACVPPVR